MWHLFFINDQTKSQRERESSYPSFYIFTFPIQGIIFESMKSLGYITLTEAEKLSGIKADTLKKRCQEGKLEGAIKQGNTWYVPRSEVIKSDEPTSRDTLLAILATLAEVGVEVGITLFVSGSLVTGQLVSKKRYFERVKSSLNRAAQLNTASVEIVTMFNKIFESAGSDKQKNIQEALEDPIHYLHLVKVHIKQNDAWMNIGEEGLRLKISAVDGFIWGSAE